MTRAGPIVRSVRTCTWPKKTVKNYVSNLLTKLGMQRRSEAAVFATKLRMECDKGRIS